MRNVSDVVYFLLGVLIFSCVGIRTAYANRDSMLDAQGIGELMHSVEDYLTDCRRLDRNSSRNRYALTHITFEDQDGVDRYLDSLRVVETHLDTELSQCSSYDDVSSAVSTSQQFLRLAERGVSMTAGNRTIIFYFEEVPDLYQDPVRLQILAEVGRVERTFADRLDVPLGDESLVFFITNRRIMEQDVGGATLGSFIWLPLEYSLGYGQRWADGVRESTVRHEIVHAFMNHTATHPFRHVFPKAFVEGMALYLADNRVIEYQRRSSVRLSDEYIRFLDAFEYLEAVGGRRAVDALIGDLLTGKIDDFFEAFEAMTGTTYEAFQDSNRNVFQRLSRFLYREIGSPQVWHQYVIVFGTLVFVVVSFTVRIPEKNANEARRNISAGFLAFIITALLTRGRIVEMAFDNYIAFLLIALFAAVLLRGYPIVRDGDIEEETPPADQAGEWEDPGGK